MALKALVKSQVRNAFKIADDLLIDVVLSQKANTTFDFNTQESNTSAPSTKTVKALFKSKSKDKNNEPTNTIKGSLLINSEDIDDNIVYVTARIDGILWNLVVPYQNNGYTTTIDIAREA